MADAVEAEAPAADTAATDTFAAAATATAPAAGTGAAIISELLTGTVASVVSEGAPGVEVERASATTPPPSLPLPPAAGTATALPGLVLPKVRHVGYSS